MEKGQRLQDFTYCPLTWLEHYQHIWMLECLLLFLTVGGVLFRGLGWDWVLMVGSMLLYVNIHWGLSLKGHNLMETFSLYERGIEVHIHYPKKRAETRWYLWSQLESTLIVTPFDRAPKGWKLMNPLQGRPGIELTFTDGYKVIAYQILEHYGEFYQRLKDVNAPNIESKLPIYDRLNQYGQHKDGKKSEFFNDGGKPASYIDIT